MRDRHASRLYRVHLALAGIGLALVLGAGVLALAGLDLRMPSAAAIATACDRWIAAGGPAALLTLGATGLATVSLALGLRSAVRQVRASRRYLAALPVAAEGVRIADEPCRVIDSAAPTAFCAGYLRPRMYLSRGALERLDPDELRAVVAHERHHARRRDPLRLLVARALAAALFFIPLLRRISERYEAIGELAADEAAVRDLERRGPLASALLKFGEAGPRSAPVVAIAPERVDHLIGDPEAGQWRLPGSLAGRSALALAALALLLILSWQVEPAPQLPILLAAACMAAMVGGPIALAVGALVLSRRALLARRG
ncbi:MAG: M56 family metallopeptidase [Solirubrobacterales bacterium]